LDFDEPSLENIQTAILLSLTFFILGQGKKCWMQLGVAIRMCTGLGLHCEQSTTSDVSVIDREVARRCFWTCYVMDRLNVAGSNRPYTILDESIKLRMPCSESSFQAGVPDESPFFEWKFRWRSERVLCNTPGVMLVDVVRILGRAIRYLQQGGSKGDSHFPWHPLSLLSSITEELQRWATRITKTVVGSSAEMDQSSTTTHFLGRAIYHHTHILLYRPFIPVFLSGSSSDGIAEHITWRDDSLRICLQHANAISNLDSMRVSNSDGRTPPYYS
jgi:hypothetical protein